MFSSAMFKHRCPTGLVLLNKGKERKGKERKGGGSRAQSYAPTYLKLQYNSFFLDTQTSVDNTFHRQSNILDSCHTMAISISMRNDLIRRRSEGGSFMSTTITYSFEPHTLPGDRYELNCNAS